MEISIEKFCSQIYDLIRELPDRDALMVLHAVEGVILSTPSPKGTSGRPARTLLRRVLVGKITGSRIDRDAELKAFILGIRKPTTLAELQKRITAKFGKKRTPSKSALHRWLQKMSGVVPKSQMAPETDKPRPFRQTEDNQAQARGTTIIDHSQP